MPILFGSVIHQNIQATELCYDAVHDFLAESGVFKVAGQQQAAAAVGLHNVLHLFGILLLGGEVADGYIGAFHGKMHGYGAANARVAARDKGHFEVVHLGWTV